MNDEIANELDFVRSQAFASDRVSGRTALRLDRRHSNLLPRLDSISRKSALPGDTKLAGPSPAGDDVETDFGQMALEPPVEPNSVIVVINGKSACLVHISATIRRSCALREGVDGSVARLARA